MAFHSDSRYPARSANGRDFILEWDKGCIRWLNAHEREFLAYRVAIENPTADIILDDGSNIELPPEFRAFLQGEAPPNRLVKGDRVICNVPGEPERPKITSEGIIKGFDANVAFVYLDNGKYEVIHTAYLTRKET